MSTPTVTKRQILAGFGWQAASTYMNRIVGLATTLILAKLLTPEQFGIVAIASMIIEVLQLLKDMGLSEALIYQHREDAVLVDTAHTILVGFNTLLFVIAAVLSPFVAQYYNSPIIMPVIIVLSSNLIWDSLRSVPRTLIRRNIDFGKLVIPEVVPVAISCVISIVMAFTGFGVWSLVAKTVVHSLLGFILLRHILPYRPSFRYDKAAARELFHYGKFIVGTTLLLVVLYNIDRFYVSSVLGLAAVGIFDLATRISDLPVKQFSHMMGTVMFPVFSKIERAGEGLRQAFLKTFKYVALVCVPVAIGISVFGPTLISLLYGPRWAGLEAPLAWLALYAMFRSLQRHHLRRVQGHRPSDDRHAGRAVEAGRDRRARHPSSLPLRGGRDVHPHRRHLRGGADVGAVEDWPRRLDSDSSGGRTAAGPDGIHLCADEWRLSPAREDRLDVHGVAAVDRGCRDRAGLCRNIGARRPRSPPGPPVPSPSADDDGEGGRPGLTAERGYEIIRTF